MATVCLSLAEIHNQPRAKIFHIMTGDWTTFLTSFYISRPFWDLGEFLSVVNVFNAWWWKTLRRQLNAGADAKVQWSRVLVLDLGSFFNLFPFVQTFASAQNRVFFHHCSINGFSFEIFPCFARIVTQPTSNPTEHRFFTTFVIALYPTNYLPDFRPTLPICIDASLYLIGVPS